MTSVDTPPPREGYFQYVDPWSPTCLALYAQVIFSLTNITVGYYRSARILHILRIRPVAVLYLELFNKLLGTPYKYEAGNEHHRTGRYYRTCELHELESRVVLTCSGPAAGTSTTCSFLCIRGSAWFLPVQIDRRGKRTVHSNEGAIPSKAFFFRPINANFLAGNNTGLSSRRFLTIYGRLKRGPRKLTIKIIALAQNLN